MKRSEVKDTFIDDSLLIKYQDTKVDQGGRFANSRRNDYEVDYRIKNIEQEAEEQFYLRQNKERILEDQRRREEQLQKELQYSAYNYHLISEQQKRNPKQLYSIEQFINTSQGNHKRDSNLARSDVYAYSERGQSFTPNFITNNSGSSFQGQNFINQDELANDIFNAEVERNYNKQPSSINNDDQMVRNVKSNEYVLNYLNNDDFNFNERKQKTYVERKLEEQESHNHNYANGKSSKHCSACQRKKAAEESKQKEQMYSGVNLNQLLLECKEALQKQYFQKSESLLNQVLRKGVEHADVYYLLDRLEEAEKYLLQALLFQFHSPYTYNSLAQVYQSKMQYERALKLYKKFVETNEEPKAFFNIGVCLVKQKEYLDSLIYFGRAIELEETEGLFYLHRADANEALGFVDMSLKDYRLFKKFSQNGLSNLENQYQLLMKNGRLAEARNLKNYIKKIESA